MFLFSSYQHKSGNLKRKERDKATADSQKGQMSLSQFLKRQRIQDKSSELDEVNASDNSTDPLSLESETDQGSTRSDETDFHLDSPNEDISEMTVNRILEDNSDQQHVLVEFDVNDIGTFSADFIPQNILDEYVKKGPSSFPSNIECDDSGKDFPYDTLHYMPKRGKKTTFHTAKS